MYIVQIAVYVQFYPKQTAFCKFFNIIYIMLNLLPVVVREFLSVLRMLHMTMENVQICPETLVQKLISLTLI